MRAQTAKPRMRAKEVRGGIVAGLNRRPLRWKRGKVRYT